MNFFYRNDEFYLRIFGIDINLKKKKKKESSYSRLVSFFPFPMADATADSPANPWDMAI